MANNMERGNETKMKRLKGGEEVRFVRLHVVYIKQRRRGGNEKASARNGEGGEGERRHKDRSIGPA